MHTIPFTSTISPEITPDQNSNIFTHHSKPAPAHDAYDIASSSHQQQTYGLASPTHAQLQAAAGQAAAGQADWQSSFAKGIIALTTFGASITFSVILSDLPDPSTIRARSSSSTNSTNPNNRRGSIRFDTETVRTFLALAWLLFVLALGFALVALIKSKKSSAAAAAAATLGAGKGGTSKTLKLLEIVLELLVLAAFMFLSLSVAAYVPSVGLAGVGFLGFFACLVLGMWCC